MIHDGSGKPETVDHQEQAYSDNFVMGSDAAEFVDKVKDQPIVKQTEKGFQTLQSQVKSSMGNIHGYDVKCCDIHGKEFLNYSKCCQES